MKKIILVFLMAFVLVGSVLAAKPLEKKDMIKIEKGNLTGLYNAQLRVSNPVALQKIQNNIDRIKEKLAIKNSTEVEIEEQNDGTFNAKINKRAKFLGFINAKVTDEATIDNNGNVVSQKKSFWRFLFRNIEE